MKNIFEILKGIGIEISEDKKAEIDKAVLENYKTVAEANKLRDARDNYKNELEKAQDALKEFEGVDVKDLQGKITELNNTIKNNQTAFDQKIADMEFDSILDGAISNSGAKNSKAVRALLDIDALKSSKNQSEDIKTAIEAVKAENDYMFKSEEPYQNQQTVGASGNNHRNSAAKTTDELSKMSFEEYRAYMKSQN